MLWGPLVLVKATAHTQSISARMTLTPCLLLALSAWAGGAATCRPGTYSLPNSDPLPPQGGAGLSRFISGSSGCPPGWLCSGKLIFIQYGLDWTKVKVISLHWHISNCCILNLWDINVFIFVCFFSLFFFFIEFSDISLSSQGSVLLCLFQVLSCILDPLLQLCTVSASNLGTADMATYMVNSLYVMKTTLALFEFTDKRLEMLEFQVCPNCKLLSPN